MAPSTTVRRSTRTVKQVSYITVAEESSGEDNASYEPITISDNSEADTPAAPPPKRKRVSKAPKTKRSDEHAASPDVSGPYETDHPTTRHDPQRLMQYLPALLDWFEEKREARGMPWRKTYDPNLTKDQRGQRAYEVLVSEIMLQQTQVATVIPYYNRWLDKFPTLESLAAADLPEVHALWKGLGYYRRAGFLLAAAKKVKAQYGGHIPEDVKVMQKEVPGMGRYTAGAVASIAYGIKAPVLDGNVQRLLSRALAIHANPKSKLMQDMLWGAATALVEAPEGSASVNAGARPGNINQALIELGSTVCRPATPLCEECPMKPGCGAYELAQPAVPGQAAYQSADIEELCKTCEPLQMSTHSVTRFPMKVDKKKARVETSVVCAMRWTSPKGEEWWLMTKRPATGLLAGLWEFPTLDLAPQNTAPGISDSENETTPRPPLGSIPPMVLPKLLAPDSAGAKLGPPNHLGSVPHIFSHIHKTYEVVYSAIEWGEDQPPQLNVISESHEKAKDKGPKTKRKRTTSCRDEYMLPAQALWVLREEVLSQNIGVGTKKVWELMLKENAV
ncbi:hypothetical protein FRC08_008643 [Ceratobasidium sp. 394]|nr:hypothetical protein FRC08_008643 [Ceratobasidium sp. 394]KAG9100754.1 hypothetical protein FS749_013051 [Ceratobasidium sp. UAMH 11750]